MRGIPTPVLNSIGEPEPNSRREKEDAFSSDIAKVSNEPGESGLGKAMPRVHTRRLGTINALILLAASLLGLASFLLPFFAGSSSSNNQAAIHGGAHSTDAPFILIVTIILCLGAVLSSLQNHHMNSKIIAVLGILTAVNAVLRAVPGPAGFAAVFALPILCGYAYGPVFGFLLGALSLLVSALLGAGVGPWLPFQMFTAGWVGMTSAWLPRMDRRPRLEIVMLALWGILWGIIYGIIMNIWFWPFVYQPQDSAMYWQQGTGVVESLKRYMLFYITTSAWWDAARSMGNFLLVLFFGAPILRMLRRFGHRFHFETI